MSAWSTQILLLICCLAAFSTACVCAPVIDGTNLFPIMTFSGHGYIDRTGKVAIKPRMRLCSERFQEGLASAENNGKWGFINTEGKFVILPQFQSVGEFREGRAMVRLGNTLSWIDHAGKVLLTMTNLESARDVSESLIGIKRNGKWGYMDTNGAVKIEASFDYGDDFEHGIARVQVKNAWGFIDKNGVFVIEPRFSSVARFQEGLARAESGGKVGYIGTNGEFQIPPEFLLGGQFSEGLAPVMKTNRWGYIDRQGQVVIPFRFTKADDFSEGLGAVMVGFQGGGYISSDGKFVIRPQFEMVSPFDRGLALVSTGLRFGYLPKYAYIDKTGKIIWPAKP